MSGGADILVCPKCRILPADKNVCPTAVRNAGFELTCPRQAWAWHRRQRGVDRSYPSWFFIPAVFLGQPSEIVFDLRFVLWSELLAGQLEHLLAVVFRQQAPEPFHRGARFGGGRVGLRQRRPRRADAAELSWPDCRMSFRREPAFDFWRPASADQAGVGTCPACTAPPSFGPAGSGGPSRSTICRWICCVPSPESAWPIRCCSLAHLPGDLQLWDCRSLSHRPAHVAVRQLLLRLYELSLDAESVFSACNRRMRRPRDGHRLARPSAVHRAAARCSAASGGSDFSTMSARWPCCRLEAAYWRSCSAVGLLPATACCNFSVRELISCCKSFRSFSSATFGMPSPGGPCWPPSLPPPAFSPGLFRRGRRLGLQRFDEQIEPPDRAALGSCVGGPVSRRSSDSAARPMSAAAPVSASSNAPAPASCLPSPAASA